MLGCLGHHVRGQLHRHLVAEPRGREDIHRTFDARENNFQPVDEFANPTGSIVDAAAVATPPRGRADTGRRCERRDWCIGHGFHGLRRTYASLRCACGDDVAYTSRQIGHTDARFTLKAYTMATRRRERLSGPHLKAYDRAIEWAQMGTDDMLERVPATAEATKNPA
jgi:hypothetical protein